MSGSSVAAGAGSAATASTALRFLGAIIDAVSNVSWLCGQYILGEQS